MKVSFRRLMRQGVGVFSSAVMAAHPVLAQVIPVAGGAEMVTAPNGVDMVLIATPNGQGVSHNQFHQFDVGAEGLILNNIADNYAATQLGGLVTGNVNLAGSGAASLILNEVVSADRSQLAGYLEVGGSRADVIVANPYGITCDGCGFLNTGRLTLTTGTPVWESDVFTGLSVDGGDIAIGGGGLDALDATRFDLLSRRMSVAGAVHGQRIRVVAGRNDVVYATGQVVEKADDGSAKPSLAIDSSVLGGMYAGAISIASTEDGVGVRAPARMAASTGEMHLTADGRLVIGRASAAGPVAVQTTQGAVEIEEVLVSESDLSVVSAEDLIAAADARIVSGAAAVFDVGRDLRAGAEGGAGAAGPAMLSLSAADTITLRGGLAGATGDISVAAMVLDIAADGALPAGRFVADGAARFQLTRLEGLGGSLTAGQRLELENAGGVLTIDGGFLQAGDDLSLRGAGVVFSGTARSLGGAVVAEAVGGDLITSGTLVGQNIDLRAAGVLETTGTVQGAERVDLTAAALINGGVVTGWDVHLAADAITNAGTAHGLAALRLISGGDVVNGGALLSDGWLTVAAGSDEGPDPALSTAAGSEIRAAGDLVLELTGLDNGGAIASSEGRLLISAAGDVTNAQTGVLYGRELLQVLSDGAVINDGGALLAEGDLVLGGLTGMRAGRFTNRNGGLVETFAGDVRIAAAVFENIRPVEIVEQIEETHAPTRQSGDCGGRSRNCVYHDVVTTVTTEIPVFGAPPTQIISGGDMRLSAETGVNAYGLISATGDLNLEFETLTNDGLDLVETTEVVHDYHRHRRSCFLFFCDDNHSYWNVLEAPVVVEAGAVFSTIEAGGAITGTVTGYLQNGAVADGVIPTVGTGAAPVAGLPTPAALVLDPLGADLSGIAAASVGNPALIVVDPDPEADYLVETRYAFVDLGHFINSDYFLSTLAYDPAAFGKRLGDPYVETQFLRAQLFALTGRRLLSPGIDERAQMRALYDNAIDAAERLDLAVGIALTPDQIAALTQDIIWLEEIVVDGQTVLAPRLYLANPETLAQTAGAVGSEAARLGAAEITLIAGAFVNSGAVTAVDGLHLVSLSDMDIHGGQLSAGGVLRLDVAGTLRSVSGTIAARDVQLAAREIDIRTATLTSGGGANVTEGAARASTILAGDSLILQAVDDIALTGAALSSGGAMTLAAGGAITVGALALERETHMTYKGGYSLSEGRTHQVSQLNAGGDMLLHAAGLTGTGGDIVLEGARLAAGGGMLLAAERGDVRLEAVADHVYSDVTGSSSGFFSSSTSRDQVFDLSHRVASLSAGAGLEVIAAGSILAEGTRFDVGGGAVTGPQALEAPDLRLHAKGGDLIFTAPTDIHAESHFYESRVLGGLGGSMSDIRTLETRSLGSVADVAGSIDLRAGGDLTLTAVDFQAGGDIGTAVAGETYLLAGVDTAYRAVSEMDNNMIVITTLDAEDYTERATFNRLEAGGTVHVDDTSAITLDAARDPLSGGSHAAGLLADGPAGMGLAASYLGKTDPATGPPQAGGAGPDDWRDDLDLITAALPTGADGAGYLYLEDVAGRADTTINPVRLIDEHFREETTQLSPAFKALITIAVTQGVGLGGVLNIAGGLETLGGLALTTTSASGVVSLTALGTAVNAFAANAVVGVIDAAVTGDMDIGAVLEDATFASLSAGLTAGINLDSTFGIEFGKDATTGLLGMGDNLSMANILEGGVDNLISSGLNSAVHGTDFGDGFAACLTSSVVSLSLADIQTGIGGMGATNPNWEGSAGHAALHAIAGCAAAELQSASCAAGAAGGLAQSLYAGTTDEIGRHLDAQRHTDTAELVSAVAGYFASGGEAENVDIAAAIGRSGFENNALCGGVCIAALIAAGYVLFSGGGDPIDGLQTIGQGEDVLSALAAAGSERAIAFASDRFPGQTEAVIDAMIAAGAAADVAVSYVDAATGHVISRSWNDIPPGIQDAIRGGVKVATFVVPAAAATRITKA
ncbi:MAG: filamentous hemagglutinin N-terminal domain-containing protein, partial [Pseudomonadota bacterium]